MYIEEYSWIEAFYMTVITVSTVGFREVHELTLENAIASIVSIVIVVLAIIIGVIQ